jgi:hypothetical protein
MQWKGSGLISSGDEAIVLSIKGSEVGGDAGETTHVICGGQDIAQLILETDTPEDVVELSGDAEQLAKILFPAQYSMVEKRDLYVAGELT